MGIQFDFLPVDGESILITTTDPDYTILIDGGKPTRANTSLLKEKLANLKIDLIILTHTDRDHIGGLINIFKSISDFDIRKIWFNCNQNIDVFEKPKSLSIDTSYKDGYNLFDLVKNSSIQHWDNITVEKYPNRISLTPDLSLQIISPTESALKNFLASWKKSEWYPINTDTSCTTRNQSDYHISLKELAVQPETKPDTRKPNLSSIAFILHYKKYNFLFLGDAHANIVIESLISLRYSERDKLNLEFIKLSHHGSSANLNYSFLNLIQTNKYIICNKGWNHLPHKKTIAYILNHHQNQSLNITSTASIKQIFKEEDQIDEHVLLDSTMELSYE